MSFQEFNIYVEQAINYLKTNNRLSVDKKISFLSELNINVLNLKKVEKLESDWIVSKCQSFDVFPEKKQDLITILIYCQKVSKQLLNPINITLPCNDIWSNPSSVILDLHYFIDMLLESEVKEKKTDILCTTSKYQKHNDPLMLLNGLQIKYAMIRGKLLQECASMTKRWNVKVYKGKQGGFDLLSNELNVALELKNSSSTDNQSSQESNRTKLTNYKKKYPQYKLYYGISNSDKTDPKTIIHDNVEIHYIYGDKLFELLFGKDYNEVINMLRQLYVSKTDYYCELQINKLITSKQDIK